jgi:hypothetical protein
LKDLKVSLVLESTALKEDSNPVNSVHFNGLALKLRSFELLAGMTEIDDAATASALS